MKVNINDEVKVKLTAHGRDCLVEYGGEFLDVQTTLALYMSTDKDGYHHFQLWKLVEIFGKYMWHGGEQLFEDNIIIIGDKT